MGIICDSISRYKLDADQILANLNKLFQGMLIRSSGVDQIKERVVARIKSKDVADIEGWKNFVNEEIYNSEFGQTTKALVTNAMQDAKANYNDQTLPLLSLLFLANSDQSTFLNAFKAVNLAQRAGQTGANIQNVYNMIPGNLSGLTGQGIFGIASGVKNIINNVGGVVHQAQNPNLVRINDLKNLVSYYINFLTLLPVNLLGKFGEGSPMKGYFITVLNNAFNKGVQDTFVNNTLFTGYEGKEEVNVEEFFNQNYNTLRNDNQIRKDFVTSYINNLTPTDIIKLMAE
jgi:hypothetical protein